MAETDTITPPAEGETVENKETAAATDAPPPRRRPGRPPSPNGKKAKKDPALYHLFSKGEKGVLTPVGDQKAKTAEGAVTEFVNNPPKGQTDFAKQVRDGKAFVVVVPERNYTEVGAEEEVRRSLKIKARK